MSRYLAMPFFHTALRRGKAVECFVGGQRAGVAGQGSTIQWVSIRCDGDWIVASLYEAEDVGHAEYLDVYSFPMTGGEPDEPQDQKSFTAIELALDHAHKAWRADMNRFVNEGVLQDEYADYVKTRGD